MGTPGNTNYPFLGGDPSGTYPRPWSLIINGVGCAIYQADENGIIESNSETGRQATVVFQCYWNQRADLIAGLLGKIDYAGGAISRTDPFGFPVTANDRN